MLCTLCVHRKILRGSGGAVADLGPAMARGGRRPADSGAADAGEQRKRRRGPAPQPEGELPGAPQDATEGAQDGAAEEAVDAAPPSAWAMGGPPCDVGGEDDAS